jgi:hypothetical protein
VVGTRVGVALGARVHALQCAGHCTRTALIVHDRRSTSVRQLGGSGPKPGHVGVGYAVGTSVGTAVGWRVGITVGVAVVGK